LNLETPADLGRLEQDRCPFQCI